MDNKINPEYLGSKFINGEYYDKKTAKFYEFFEKNNNSNNKNKITSITNDITELKINDNTYSKCILA
jgi:hypothetical protein